ncbi:presenilin family intramembrane aspartyl protease PSH [Halorarum halobium]|uniref:presenilin family intramembrane aspartyl protease PSH n=1 Tax=Halorarum halobium TaxID=3075121 RepID=UPI0028A9C32E|nr:presenilin family intramembrane aspartyl protease PSH [Halobaculum sp. XH14]
MNTRRVRGVAIAGLVFLVVQVGAVSLVPAFESANYQATENPQDPTNSVVYLGAILVVTALMLAAFRYDLDQLIRGVIVLSSGLLAWYVFSVALPPNAAVVAAALVAVALWVYPEWYVIDTAGALMGAGAAGLFGISFGLLPAIVLLTALAVYDAISVYGTEHMLDLAEGVMALKIPVVLVIPLTWSYSLLDAEFADEDDADTTDGPDVDGPETADGGVSERESGPERHAHGGEDDERDVFFIGLGDAVMPAVMVASAAFWSPATPLGIPGLPAMGLPALLSMVGTFLGLGLLLRMVMKGRAHAGLPLLNGGAIGGYLLGSLVAGVPLVTALGLGTYL